MPYTYKKITVLKNCLYMYQLHVYELKLVIHEKA